MSRFFLDYFTSWTLILYVSTIILCIIFPGYLPLWLWTGVACLMTTVAIIGTFFFTSIHLYIKKDSDVNEAELISSDFLFHVFPLLVLFVFYKFLKDRFYYSKSSNIMDLIKSVTIPLILAIIYVSLYNVEKVYHFSELNTEIIIILAISVWLSSYQIFKV